MKPKAAALFEELLRDARILADFSNLDKAGVDYFRNNYSGFVPYIWWHWQVGTNPKLWKEHQQTLRDAWQAGFPVESSIRLISTGAISDELASSMDAAFRKMNVEPGPITPNVVVIPTSSPLVSELEPDMWIKSSQVWPYQRAVMFLATTPWRARHCSICLKRFVAAEPKQTLCSEECRQEAERRRKRKWWGRSGKGWRSKKAKSRRKKAR